MVQERQEEARSREFLNDVSETFMRHPVFMWSMLMVDSITCNSYSDNEAASPCGFVDFLAADSPNMSPIPRSPCEVPTLNNPHSDVSEEQMSMRHCAQVKKRTPSHCGISKEASMACRAASCSSNWRRRSRAKRNTTIQMPQTVQPAKFQ